ncbi:hypothetical protein ACGFNV_18380 [Streptomyces sp. NPDC048751]|uniref:hypothetical protein n=1 Tax=Streptomyces sp. NPDC048751 TaxID=3365591 RepID=UPI003712B268
MPAPQRTDSPSVATSPRLDSEATSSATSDSCRTLRRNGDGRASQPSPSALSGSGSGAR